MLKLKRIPPPKIVTRSRIGIFRKKVTVSYYLPKTRRDRVVRGKTGGGQLVDGKIRIKRNNQRATQTLVETPVVTTQIRIIGLNNSLKTFLSKTRNFNTALQNTPSSPMRSVYKKWAVRYRAFIQNRFNTYSRGGGDWPPLKAGTIRRRRGPAKRTPSSTAPRRVSILRNTGILFNALNPTYTARPGQYEKMLALGIAVGYGGPQRHGKGRATVADIASFHQIGNDILPKREIIVLPPDWLLNLMARDMEEGFKKLGF